ncbi:thioredoxin domain-containing protein [Formicincola oecophyllae]|uniref:Thioredoxin domain-containing protein n=1 Tax=Formicincola oecophyllae TaxID=2558361 RepID=A0A4Y6U6X4_9PROT|nr:thioredoxin domain-containing protein [Formicincola oecophyllae]QDH12904.1 thioredoxin domain-containing protein [Formicincola oecophyllae]
MVEFGADNNQAKATVGANAPQSAPAPGRRRVLAMGGALMGGAALGALLPQRLAWAASPKAVVAANAGVVLGKPAFASPIDPRLSVRALGNPNAPVTVCEWFSLTCVHCAHFALDVFPKVKEDYIDTGKVRFEFWDYPLDRIGLVAAMVARSLPPERYLPFIDSLFSRQMKWAFGGGDPLKNLQQEAALAGVSAGHFEEIRNDKALAQAIYNTDQAATKLYDIKGTPYFRFNNIALAQDPGSIDKFGEMVDKAMDVLKKDGKLADQARKDILKTP